MRLKSVIAGGLCLAASLVGAGRSEAGPTLLFDPENGHILYAEQADDQWHPASLTKIMTAYLVFEAIREGRVTLETRIKVSELAHEQPPSKVGLPVDADMPMETAIKALIIKSANDVAVMLAEAIAGSQEAFVERMNAKARQLGMKHTTFVNPNGLPAAGQITTARDLARLSTAVTKDFPEYAPYWSMQQMELGKIKLASHNGLLKTFDGADGLKTGFICDSGFNIVASANRGQRRMMAVVLGEATASDRTGRAAALLEHGFETYGWKSAYSTASIHDSPVLATAAPVQSVRSHVKVIACGWRPPKLKKVHKVSEKADATRRSKQAKAKDASRAPKQQADAKRETAKADVPSRPRKAHAKTKVESASPRAQVMPQTTPKPAAAP